MVKLQKKQHQHLLLKKPLNNDKVTKKPLFNCKTAKETTPPADLPKY